MVNCLVLGIVNFGVQAPWLIIFPTLDLAQLFCQVGFRVGPTAVELCFSTRFFIVRADLSLLISTQCFLTLLEPQSRSGDKPVKFQVVWSPNRTAVLKGLTAGAHHTVGRPGSLLIYTINTTAVVVGLEYYY